ncbi:MAG: MurR/RpiR family transcriptional regulator [Oscillospiraceae bacterium]|nr:MurR/RpiR family transcriptional regulator [Oscillospiraceae bacterium]
MKNILKRLEDDLSTYSKTQRLIAEYILENYDKAAFMTAAKLSAKTGASESTVVRFAAELGYDGYPAMQRELQNVIKNKLTATQRIEITGDKIRADVVDSVLRADAENILATIDTIDRDEFNKVIECILSAHNIYIIGIRASSALAQFLGFYLNHIVPNVHVISTISGSEVFEQILRVSGEDAFIGVSFPRYSKRTLKAMKYAHSKGAKVIAITDTESSPLCQYADYKMTARSGMVSFADSLVAPLSLINAIIAALSIKKENEVVNTLSSLEAIWDEYNVYEKSDNE